MFAIKRDNGLYFIKIRDGFAGPKLIFGLDCAAIFHSSDDRELLEIKRQIDRKEIKARIVELVEKSRDEP